MSVKAIDTRLGLGLGAPEPQRDWAYTEVRYADCCSFCDDCEHIDDWLNDRRRATVVDVRRLLL